MRALVFAFVVALALLSFAPVPAQAVLIACDADTPGDCSGSLTYNQSLSQLTFTIFNTSPNGGGLDDQYLTAVAFNNPDDSVFSAALVGTASPSTFSFTDGTPNGISTANFGSFDFLLAIGGSFDSGGTVTDGVPPLGALTFTVQITGAGSGLLTEASFTSALSTGGPDGSTWGAVRFRGFSNDAATRTGDADPLDVAAVPAPLSLVLVGAGLVSLGAVIRRKAKR